MRILFDSKELIYKDPFGCLTPGQKCTLHIHIPDTAQATGVFCVFSHEDGTEAFSLEMFYTQRQGDYSIYKGEFSLSQTGLYFYAFYVKKAQGGFRLLKAGNGTNMEGVLCTCRQYHPPVGTGRDYLSDFPRPVLQSGRL